MQKKPLSKRSQMAKHGDNFIDPAAQTREQPPQAELPEETPAKPAETKKTTTKKATKKRVGRPESKNDTTRNFRTRTELMVQVGIVCAIRQIDFSTYINELVEKDIKRAKLPDIG